MLGYLVKSFISNEATLYNEVSVCLDAILHSQILLLFSISSYTFGRIVFVLLTEPFIYTLIFRSLNTDQLVHLTLRYTITYLELNNYVFKSSLIEI